MFLFFFFFCVQVNLHRKMSFGDSTEKELKTPMGAGKRVRRGWGGWGGGMN